MIKGLKGWKHPPITPPPHHPHYYKHDKDKTWIFFKDYDFLKYENHWEMVPLLLLIFFIYYYFDFFFNIWCNQYTCIVYLFIPPSPLVRPSIFISIFQTFDINFSNVKRLKYSLSRITSALSVREGTPSREEGHLELLDLRIHSKRYSESYW